MIKAWLMTSSECLAKAFTVVLNASQQATDLVVEPARGAAKQRIAELEHAFSQAQTASDFDTMLWLSGELHGFGLELVTSQREAHSKVEA